MKKEYKWGIGIAIFSGIIYMATKKKKSSSKYKEDDINLLQPAFRDKVKQVISNLKKRGYDPILFDSGRTQKEAETYAKKGTGIKQSLHLTGAAADIISASKGWNDINFFIALGQEAKKLGLTWGANRKQYGGDFITRNDMPHIQAVPVKYQNEYRALTSNAARNEYIENYFSSIEITKKIPIV